MTTMNIELINGCTVTRVVGSGNETEFLAAFQYETDAKEFIERRLASDAERQWWSQYVLANCYSGRVKVFAPLKPDNSAAA